MADVRRVWFYVDGAPQASGVRTVVSMLCARLPDHGIECVVLATAAPDRRAALGREFDRPLFLDPKRRLALELGKAVEQLRPTSADVVVADASRASRLLASMVARRGGGAIACIHSDHEIDYESAIQVAQVFRGTRIVTVSQAISIQLAERVARHGLDATVVPIRTGVEIRSPDRYRANRPGPLRLVYVGRLERDLKRVDRLVGIVRECLYAGTDVALDVVGDGSEREVIARDAAQAGLDGRIRLFGHVERDDLIERLRAYDGILLVSDVEGMPLVLLEAMAVGVVPIASRTRSGVPELIEHGFNGLLVNDPTDLREYARAIAKMADDPSWLEGARMGAIRTVANGFSVRSMVDAWVEQLRATPRRWEPRALPLKDRGSLAVASIGSLLDRICCGRRRETAC